MNDRRKEGEEKRMKVHERMKELGIELPPAPAKGGLYASAKEFGSGLLYVSGCGPASDVPVRGKLGKEFSLEEGQYYARMAMLNVLSVVEKQAGSLDRVKNVVKILCFVASEDDFYEQPAVANGASQLLKDIFGEEVGVPSRSAIGVNVLPGNLPVEIEAIFELE